MHPVITDFYGPNTSWVRVLFLIFDFVCLPALGNTLVTYLKDRSAPRNLKRSEGHRCTNAGRCSVPVRPPLGSGNRMDTRIRLPKRSVGEP